MLLSESRVDRHHQHLVHIRQDLLQNSGRGSRVEDHTGAATELPDLLHGAMQVRIPLPMHENGIRTCDTELLKVEIWVGHHHVRFQRQAGYLAQTLDDHGTERKIRHKMPVHHIHVDAVSAASLGLDYLLAQVCEVGGQDGWGKFDHFSPFKFRQRGTGLWVELATSVEQERGRSEPKSAEI